jgi:hypothetical protein
MQLLQKICAHGSLARFTSFESSNSSKHMLQLLSSMSFTEAFESEEPSLTGGVRPKRKLGGL